MEDVIYHRNAFHFRTAKKNLLIFTPEFEDETPVDQLRVEVKEVCFQQCRFGEHGGTCHPHLPPGLPPPPTGYPTPPGRGRYRAPSPTPPNEPPPSPPPRNPASLGTPKPEIPKCRRRRPPPPNHRERSAAAADGGTNLKASHRTVANREGRVAVLTRILAVAN